MAMFEVLPEVVCTKELLRVVALAKLMHLSQMLYPCFKISIGGNSHATLWIYWTTSREFVTAVSACISVVWPRR